MNFRRNMAGFTLAELLIALAILGVIATFTIPKILNGQQDSKRKAVFRETIAAMTEVLYVGTLQGINWSTADVSDEIKARMNVLKICEDAGVDGCWSHSMPAAAGASSEDGLIFGSGAVVGGLYGGGASSETIAIDWNGSTAPNTEGQDQIVLRYCYSTGCSNGQRSGTLEALPTSAPSVALYQEIFSN